MMFLECVRINGDELELGFGLAYNVATQREISLLDLLEMMYAILVERNKCQFVKARIC